MGPRPPKLLLTCVSSSQTTRKRSSHCRTRAPSLGFGFAQGQLGLQEKGRLRGQGLWAELRSWLGRGSRVPWTQPPMGRVSRLESPLQRGAVPTARGRVETQPWAEGQPCSRSRTLPALSPSLGSFSDVGTGCLCHSL